VGRFNAFVEDHTALFYALLVVVLVSIGVAVTGDLGAGFVWSLRAVAGTLRQPGDPFWGD
jgi:hypothetical protein